MGIRSPLTSDPQDESPQLVPCSNSSKHLREPTKCPSCPQMLSSFEQSLPPSSFRLATNKPASHSHSCDTSQEFEDTSSDTHCENIPKGRQPHDTSTHAKAIPRPRLSNPPHSNLATSKSSSDDLFSSILNRPPTAPLHAQAPSSPPQSKIPSDGSGMSQSQPLTSSSPLSSSCSSSHENEGPSIWAQISNAFYAQKPLLNTTTTTATNNNITKSKPKSKSEFQSEFTFTSVFESDSDSDSESGPEHTSISARVPERQRPSLSQSPPPLLRAWQLLRRPAAERERERQRGRERERYRELSSSMIMTSAALEDPFVASAQLSENRRTKTTFQRKLEFMMAEDVDYSSGIEEEDEDEDEEDGGGGDALPTPIPAPVPVSTVGSAARKSDEGIPEEQVDAWAGRLNNVKMRAEDGRKTFGFGFDVDFDFGKPRLPKRGVSV